MEHKKQYPECFVTLTAIACKTKKISFGPLVLNNLFRNPTIVAKMGATIDQISRGRFRLGIGAGWYRRECEAFGIDFPSFNERIERLKEAVEIILKLWKSKGKEVTYFGKYYKLKNAICLPSPYIDCPPIFLGGRSLPILKIAVRNSIGINIDQDWNISLAEAQKILNSLQFLCKEEGKNFKEIRKSLCIRIFVGSEKEVEAQIKKWKETFTEPLLIKMVKILRSLTLPKDLRVVKPTSWIMGSPEICKAQIKDYILLGFTEIYFKVYDYTDVELLETISNEIVDPLREELR